MCVRSIKASTTRGRAEGLCQKNLGKINECDLARRIIFKLLYLYIEIIIMFIVGICIQKLIKNIVLYE